MRSYRAFSLILANALVLFALVNIPAALFVYLRPPIVPKVHLLPPEKRTEGRPDFSYRKKWKGYSDALFRERQSYQEAWVDLKSYEGKNVGDTYQILDDYFRRGRFTFSPYVQFADAPFRSPTLNIEIDPSGFSYRIGAGTSPGEKDVYVFGGSTAFGVGVSDEETFPEFLREHLASDGASVRITNFGRCGYSWMAELALLNQLLVTGHRPAAVVFLDGVNIPSPGGPQGWSDRLSMLWEKEQMGLKESLLPSWVPVFEMLNRWKSREARAKFQAEFPRRKPQFQWETEGQLGNPIADDYRKTHRIARSLATEFGIESLFVWQPNRGYGCDRGQYRRDVDPGYAGAVTPVYQAMENYQSEGFINLAGLCQDRPETERLFVDDVHYTPAFNRELAEKVGNVLLEKLQGGEGTNVVPLRS